MDNINMEALAEYDRYINECWDEFRQMAYEITLNVKEFDQVNPSSKYSDILKHIHYIMQPAVEKIIEALDKNREEYYNCKIIVFGSSTNANCNNDSDIDLAYLYMGKNLKEFKKKLFTLLNDTLFDLNILFDLVNLEHAKSNPKIYKTITERGVIIWDTQA